MPIRSAHSITAAAWKHLKFNDFLLGCTRILFAPTYTVDRFITIRPITKNCMSLDRYQLQDKH